MNPLRLFQPGQSPWANGLRLALLNAALAAFSIVSFLGVLSIVEWMNQIRFASGNISSVVPFPYFVLMLLYAILFLVIWVWFGRRLPGARREKVIAVLVGAAPLLVLSLLGYAGMIGTAVFNEMDPSTVPAASVFVFGGISTLILLATITCAGLVLLASGTNPASVDAVSTELS